MAELVTTSTGVHYDDLIGGTNVSVVAQNVKVTSGTAMARGTLLTITDGTAAATAKAGTANAFNREKITVADTDTIGAHEAELRNVGIYLTSLKG